MRTFGTCPSPLLHHAVAVDSMGQLFVDSMSPWGGVANLETYAMSKGLERAGARE